MSGLKVVENTQTKRNSLNSFVYRGTSGIDIDLRRLDIDQCPLPPGSTQLNIFAASDKCKKRTTEVGSFDDPTR